jgi:hypothetical protein
MNKKQIKSALHNYHWMIQTIVLKRRELRSEAGDHITPLYGIEASLPKGKGKPSDPIYFEILRRERENDNIQRLLKKVKFIQEHVHVITDEKEITVMNRILDGMSLRKIAYELGIPFTNVRRIRDNIVEKIYQSGSNGSNGANGANQTKLQKVSS